MESKRIKVLPKNPNPLFKMWLKEWLEDAEKKKKRISKTYQKALDTLNRYPLTLYSGHDCAILENFGPKICQMLDEKLEKHLNQQPDLNQKLCYKDKISEIQRREALKVSDLIQSIEAACLVDTSFAPDTLNDVEMAEIQSQIDISTEDHEDSKESIPVDVSQDDVEIPEELLSSSADSEDSLDRLVRKYDPEAADNRKKLKKKKTKENPIRRQKPPAAAIDDILDLTQEPLTLINSPVSTVTKGGTRFKKFRTFDNGKRHLAGPSYASSPISKFLDVETNHHHSPISPVQAYDDEFDKLVAKYPPSELAMKPPSPVKLTRKPSKSKQMKIKELPKINEIPSKATQVIQEDDEDELKYISIDDIDPLDYKVVLLVDVSETIGKSKSSSDETLVKLRESNVTHDVRKLNVGDFLWIAQHKTDKAKEFVLPYIIERKRLDDLSSSIKDGRFHEQKFRLKKCGVENVIYLIENHVKAGKVQCGLPFTTLLQAATNTQIHSKFQVKFTENNQHTILYLTVMSSFIENIFKNKAPIKFQMMEFLKFNQSAVKQRKCTVRETFIKQLLALKGLSVDIALEITNNYPTPTDLYNTYRKSSKEDGENLLTKITIGELKRKIPKPISKTIYNFYMCDNI